MVEQSASGGIFVQGFAKRGGTMTFLRSYFWILLVAAWITAVGFLTSAAVTSLGARYLIDDASIKKLPQEVELQLAVMASQAPKAGEKGGDKGELEIKSREILASMNLFCPTCKAKEEEPEPVEEAEPEEEEESDELLPSSLPYTLAATMEADRPRYSIAVLVHTETRSTQPLSPGDELQEGVVIDSVGRARVILRNQGKLEYIDVNGTPPPPRQNKKPKRSTPKKKKPKRKKRRNPRAIEGAAEAIDCRGNTCTVDKSFRDKIIANPALLAKQARVIPAIRDGETRGFKFYGIRNGSLPKLLGVKNGDLITSINGSQLRNYDEVLGLYNKLRRANHISVGIERNGKQVTKEVNFR